MLLYGSLLKKVVYCLHGERVLFLHHQFAKLIELRQAALSLKNSQMKTNNIKALWLRVWLLNCILCEPLCFLREQTAQEMIHIVLSHSWGWALMFRLFPGWRSAWAGEGGLALLEAPGEAGQHCGVLLLEVTVAVAPGRKPQGERCAPDRWGWGAAPLWGIRGILFPTYVGFSSPC